MCEVLLVMADLTKIQLLVGPSLCEVLLVMADLTRETAGLWGRELGGRCCSSLAERGN